VAGVAVSGAIGVLRGLAIGIMLLCFAVLGFGLFESDI
jgi:hypothetical protein